MHVLACALMCSRVLLSLTRVCRVTRLTQHCPVRGNVGRLQRQMATVVNGIRNATV